MCRQQPIVVALVWLTDESEKGIEVDPCNPAVTADKKV